MPRKEKEEFNCWGHDFIYSFLSQFFDIGSSAGSLIIEAINIFRLFQRISASQIFSSKISNSCRKYFNWARDIFQTIVDSLFRVKPFTDFELFSIYNYVFPISILTFVLFAGHEIKIGFWVYFIFYILIISFGCGFGFIGINNLCTILLTTISGIFLLIFCLIIYFHVIKTKTKKKILENKTQALLNVSPNFVLLSSSDDSEIEEVEIEDEKNHKCCETYPLKDFINTRSFILSCIIFSVLIIPYSLYRSKLKYMIAVIIGIFILIFFIVELVFIKYFDVFYLEEEHDKLVCLFVNFYSLLIVPNTEKFVEIMQGFYEKKWNLIIGYIFNCLVNSLTLSFFSIYVNYDEMVQKYKLTESEKKKEYHEFNYYSLFEIGDTIRQITYAILSSYDIIWGCVGIEIAWFVLIIVFRPYRNVSDYTLAFGTTTILIISNGVILYTEYNGNIKFSFTITILLVVGACIPPILSLLLYFIFDFGREKAEVYGGVISFKHQKVGELSFSLEVFLALSWLVYGFYIPMMFIHNST